MARRKITIPAAGESIPVTMTGRSIIVEFSKVYESPEDVPLLGFDSGGDQKPIYPRSTYNNKGDIYNNLVIVGTAASEGDEIYLINSQDCLKEEIIIQFNESYSSFIKATQNFTMDDTVFEFSSAQMLNGSDLPAAATIQVIDGATDGIRFEFDSDPDQAAGRTSFLWTAENGLLDLPEFVFIDGFRAIAAVAGESPKIIVQFEYRK